MTLFPETEVTRASSHSPMGDEVRSIGVVSPDAGAGESPVTPTSMRRSPGENGGVEETEKLVDPAATGPESDA